MVPRMIKYFYNVITHDTTSKQLRKAAVLLRDLHQTNIRFTFLSNLDIGTCIYGNYTTMLICSFFVLNQTVLSIISTKQSITW